MVPKINLLERLSEEPTLSQRENSATPFYLTSWFTLTALGLFGTIMAYELQESLKYIQPFLKSAVYIPPIGFFFAATRDAYKRR